MEEFLKGGRFGFAPRAALAYIAGGIGLSLTLSDLMAWFAWGGRDTGGYTVVADWLSHVVTVALGIAVIASLAEYIDVPPDDRSIARLDLVACLVAFLLYGASAFLRGFDVGGAAASPAPFLLAVAGLIVAFVDAALTANLYSAREWEELDEEPVREHRPRRRAASR